VQTDAIITHANIEAVSASLAVALTVDGCLRRRLNSRQILLTAGVASCQASGAAKPLTRVSCALDRAIILLGERTAPAQVASELGRHGGAAATVATALYCAALHADDFRAGVVAAVRSGGDTDTRAAIAGTILGATLGLEAIPEEYLAGLHRIEYLKDLDAKLYALRAQVTLDKR
jgi:ADP-ribosylglycohydrolase